MIEKQNSSNLSVHLSNQLIEAEHNMQGVDAYRIVLLSIAKICQQLKYNPKSNSALVAKISINELKAIFPSFLNAGNIHQRIDHATDDIVKHSLVKVWQKDEGNFKKVAFINTMEYKNFNELCIKFNEEAMPYFNTKSEFTKYLLHNTSQLSSYQQIRLYELCYQYVKLGERKIEIDLLKRFLRVEKEKDNRHVLRNIRKLINKINQKTNIEIELDSIKTGRKVTHIKFTIRNKNETILESINKQKTDLKSQLLGLGFQSEKIDQIFKIPLSAIIVALDATRKKQGQFVKSMEAYFFSVINKHKSLKLSSSETVILFKNSLSIQQRETLRTQFFNTLTQEEHKELQEPHSEFVKDSINVSLKEKFNQWVFDTQIQPNLEQNSTNQ